MTKKSEGRGAEKERERVGGNKKWLLRREKEEKEEI